MANNSQMQVEFKFFGEVWTLYKRYYDCKIWSDEMWMRLINEANTIIVTYNNPLCRDLVNSVLADLERRSQGCI